MDKVNGHRKFVRKSNHGPLLPPRNNSSNRLSRCRQISAACNSLGQNTPRLHNLFDLYATSWLSLLLVHPLPRLPQLVLTPSPCHSYGSLLSIERENSEPLVKYEDYDRLM